MKDTRINALNATFLHFFFTDHWTGTNGTNLLIFHLVFEAVAVENVVVLTVYNLVTHVEFFVAEITDSFLTI